MRTALIQINDAHSECADKAQMNLFRLCTGGDGHALAAGGGLAALLLLGISGSLLHCGPMCGPLVLGQSVHRLACLPCARMSESARLKAGLLLSYHAGRITSYAALGAMAGAATFAVSEAMRVVCLLSASVFLLTLALSGGRLRPPAPAAQAWLARRMAPGGYLFGLVMGLMPCGLLYGALLAASATGGPARGAAGMAAFGLGTLPMLTAIGVAGRTGRLRVHLRRAVPVLLVFNALIIFAAALETAHLF